MDYEKAYINAVARAKQAIKDCGHNEGQKRMIEDIFPELAESEDEKIRKWIRTFIEVRLNGAGEFIDDYKNAIAWLEKQGEQNSADSFCSEYETH